MSAFGKWSQAGVPKKAWICVGFEDLGEPSVDCQMCENQQIRFVHHMEHPNYPEALDCGCDCAGKMEENYTAAESRLTNLKNAARRKTNWLKRKWKNSQSGNHYLKTDGYHVVVFEKSGSWSGTITEISTQTKTHARKLYPSQDAVKLACFDGMIWLKGR